MLKEKCTNQHKSISIARQEILFLPEAKTMHSESVIFQKLLLQRQPIYKSPGYQKVYEKRTQNLIKSFILRCIPNLSPTILCSHKNVSPRKQKGLT